jgi:hypothetical protein
MPDDVDEVVDPQRLEADLRAKLPELAGDRFFDEIVAVTIVTLGGLAGSVLALRSRRRNSRRRKSACAGRG